MQRIVLLIMLTMPLSTCGTVEQDSSSGLCKGLKDAIDEHADTILEYSKRTPAPVILSGTKVIKGYDEGCKE